MERYNHYSKSGEPICESLFAPERFLDIRPRDTFYKDFTFFPGYEQVRDKYATATVVGDKVPKYYLKYNEALENLPDARFIYILRNIYDVAASYKARAAKGTLWPRWRNVLSAIEDWNLSLRQTARFIDSGRIHIVPYEDFFLKGDGVDALWAFLELDASALGDNLSPVDRPIAATSSSAKVLDAHDAYRIATEADFALYRALLSRA